MVAAPPVATAVAGFDAHAGNGWTEGRMLSPIRRIVRAPLVNADATHIEATIGDDPGEIAPVREAVHDLAERAGYGERAHDLALAVDELIANAQEHGAAPIHVVAQADEDSGVHVEVCDAGSGFDWGEAVREHPPRPDSRRGRGLWIVRQLVDRVTVERDDDHATRIRVDLEQAA